MTLTARVTLDASRPWTAQPITPNLLRHLARTQPQADVVQRVLAATAYTIGAINAARAILCGCGCPDEYQHAEVVQMAMDEPAATRTEAHAALGQLLDELDAARQVFLLACSPTRGRLN